MTNEILQRIESVGRSGIKKADLKKIYGKSCEEVLEKLKNDEKIFIEKKGVANFVWTKENYVQHLSEDDPKFKLMLNMVAGVSHSIARLEEQTHTLHQEIEDIAQEENFAETTDFGMIFDKCLREASTSVGWAPFSKIRERVCQTKNLSKERFYTLASNLIEKNGERYEISSGGQEGVVIRGLVHGYVRNV